MGRADVDIIDIVLWLPWLGRSIHPSAGPSPQTASVRFLFSTRKLEEGKLRFPLLVLHQMVIFAGARAVHHFGILTVHPTNTNNTTLNSKIRLFHSVYALAKHLLFAPPKWQTLLSCRWRRRKMAVCVGERIFANLSGYL